MSGVIHLIIKEKFVKCRKCNKGEIVYLKDAFTHYKIDDSGFEFDF